MNPYDFVRLPDRVARESVLRHERFRGHSGAMRCRLTAIKPIFIPYAQVTGGPQRFMTGRYQGQDLPLIPGSSLKGVIRSVAEAVSLSCIGLSGELFDRGGTNPRYQGKASLFLTCDRISVLCPACRLFGMVSSQSHFLGKVSLSDARTENGKYRYGPQMILLPLMEPKPRHTAFYQPSGIVAGRKFYFHHAGAPKTAAQPTGFTKTVIPLEGLDASGQPQTVFEFDVTFANLTDEEYSFLIFALILTDDMRHKIGGGKPLGMGTAKIEVIKLNEIDSELRYRGLGERERDAPTGRVLEGEALQAQLQKYVAPIVSTPSSSLQDLQRIWKYPPATDAKGQPIEYKYPDQRWFAENPQTPIADTP